MSEDSARAERQRTLEEKRKKLEKLKRERAEAEAEREKAEAEAEFLREKLKNTRNQLEEINKKKRFFFF